MPFGPYPKLAHVPTPSDDPDMEGNNDPASVVTNPDDVICRIELLSVTYSVPNASTATPAGSENDAAVPTPSIVIERPIVLPANVVTTAEGEILRIL